MLRFQVMYAMKLFSLETFHVHICIQQLVYILIHINSGTEHPKLKELYKHIKRLIAARWFDVGVELFDEDDIRQLNAIKSSHHGNAEACCIEMLSLWHEKYPKATWNDFIRSLNAPGVELHDTADKIEDMLLSPGKPKNL